MAIQIFTDSTGDIPRSMQEQLKIHILPLTVRFGDEEYKDGVNLSLDEFYTKLISAEKLPTTSQVPVGVFIDGFRQALDSGDEVLGIFLASQLSGTYQSAVMAKEYLKSDKIYLVDSQSATLGIAAQVYEAIKMRDAGMLAEEIAEELRSLQSKQKLFAILETLKYVKMGGRLSATKAMVGSILHIRPVVIIQEGRVILVHLAKGSKNALRWVYDEVAKSKIDYGRKIFVGHSRHPAILTSFVEQLKDKVPQACYDIWELGITVGTYGGPGLVGITYFEK